MTGNLIRTSYVNPPIPVRDFDWQAVLDKYDGDETQPVGHGKNELSAIRDLLEKIEDSK